MQQIYSFLKSNEAHGTIIKGVKVLDKHSSRAGQLIERLKAFTPPDLTDEALIESHFVNQANKEWYMYRNLAIIAINEYIKEFPFLMHTPSSLRSIFGMPTRKDRKRGRYSGKELIDNALENLDDFHESMNYEAVEELRDHLHEVGESNPEYKTLCIDLVEYLNANINRNSQTETFVPEINTHSFDSLEHAKIFLQEIGFKNVIHERDEEYPYNGEDALFTPDLVCKYWNEYVWFELKEWESFNNFFSPLKQLLNYLDANTGKNKNKSKSYVGILVTQPVQFYKFLLNYKNSEITFTDLRTAITPKLNEIKKKLDNIHETRNDYLKLGRLMVKNQLQIKTEALYIGLFSEFVNKELGMLQSEYEAGVQILTLINELESRADNILILPIDDLEKVETPNNTLILFLGILKNSKDSNRVDPDPNL